MTDLFPHRTQKITFHVEQGALAQACHPRTWDVDAGQSGIQVCSLKCSEFEVSLDYVRLSQKKKKPKLKDFLLEIILNL